MTNEELTKKVEDLQKELNQLKDVYYRTHYIDKDVFTNPVYIKGKVSFFGKNPVGIQSAITPPSGGVTIDAEARTAINSIITTLQTFLTL